MRLKDLDPEDIPALMDGRLGARPDVADRADAYLPSPCPQNHAANLALLADGTLTCLWFAGTMEGRGDISVYLSRLPPGGERWSKPERLSDDPARSEQNPLFFKPPDGRVFLLFTSQTAGNQDGAVVKQRVSTDGGATFGPATVMCSVPGTFVRQPGVVNAAGAYIIPVFRCNGVAGERWTGDTDTAAVLVSEIGGATWSIRDVPDSIGAVHMNILPLGGGRMVAFYRDRFAGAVLSSRSTDDGLNWSAPVATNLPNNNASIQAVRLSSGVIAMVYNHASAATSDDRRQSLYDEIEDGDGLGAVQVTTRRRAIWGVPRSPLALAISTDEGRRFRRVLDLDDGPGTCLSNDSIAMKNRELSYPSLAERPDGGLDVAFTVFRRAIKHVRLGPRLVASLVDAATAATD